MASTLLLGPISLDRYVAEGLVLPGGGALNVAYHWSQLGFPFHLLSRVGDGDTELCEVFLQRHAIAHSASLAAPGLSSSIDISLRGDGQPWMDNFAEGVWRDFRLDSADEQMVATARRLHAVLVDPVQVELIRLADTGLLDALDVSGDFLDFRHVSIARFAELLRVVRIGFIGWPGDPADPTLDQVRAVAFELGRLVVVTMGARQIRVFDGRGSGEEHRFAVTPVEVAGTSIGCGDAFIAAFLAAWWSGASLAAAVEQGSRQGAAATAWRRPLPDAAFGVEPSA